MVYDGGTKAQRQWQLSARIWINSQEPEHMESGESLGYVWFGKSTNSGEHVGPPAGHVGPPAGHGAH